MRDHFCPLLTTMSLATTVPRKTAQRIAKPATRYWKGKAPQGITAVQSDSDEDEDEEQEQAEGDVPLDEELRAQSDDEEGMTLRKEVTKSKAMNIALKDVSVSSDGKVRVAGKEESGRTAQELREFYTFHMDRTEQTIKLPRRKVQKRSLKKKKRILKKRCVADSWVYVSR